MKPIWLLPVAPILLATAGVAFVALMYSTWLWIPTILVGSVLGTGCLEKAAGAGFFPWKWQWKGGSNGQTCESQVARQSARNAKGSKG